MENKKIARDRKAKDREQTIKADLIRISNLP